MTSYKYKTQQNTKELSLPLRESDQSTQLPGGTMLVPESLATANSPVRNTRRPTGLQTRHNAWPHTAVFNSDTFARNFQERLTAD